MDATVRAIKVTTVPVFMNSRKVISWPNFLEMLTVTMFAEAPT
jgi:hypothetical protein